VLPLCTSVSFVVKLSKGVNNEVHEGSQRMRGWTRQFGASAAGPLQLLGIRRP
jgi:hypothetical protein